MIKVVTGKNLLLLDLLAHILLGIAIFMFNNNINQSGALIVFFCFLINVVLLSYQLSFDIYEKYMKIKKILIINTLVRFLSVISFGKFVDALDNSSHFKWLVIFICVFSVNFFISIRVISKAKIINEKFIEINPYTQSSKKNIENFFTVKIPLFVSVMWITKNFGSSDIVDIVFLILGVVIMTFILLKVKEVSLLIMSLIAIMLCFVYRYFFLEEQDFFIVAVSLYPYLSKTRKEFIEEYKNEIVVDDSIKDC